MIKSRTHEGEGGCAGRACCTCSGDALADPGGSVNKLAAAPAPDLRKLRRDALENLCGSSSIGDILRHDLHVIVLIWMRGKVDWVIAAVATCNILTIQAGAWLRAVLPLNFKVRVTITQTRPGRCDLFGNCGAEAKLIALD